MSYLDNSVDFSQFITVDQTGVRIATYPQIVKALTDMFKATYGQDIDVSTGTADNVYISNVALIINNILRSMSLLYANMNVNTATGKNLDSLCNLANIRRKSATYSVAKIKVTNTSTTTNLVIENGFSVQDSSGLLWTYNDATITIAPSSYTEINVTCTKAGPIECPAGSLIALENADYTVTQENAASVGSEAETDSELRARRAYAVGAAGTTVLESLHGALLSLAGVKDAYIYNNNDLSQESITLSDGTEVYTHDIFIALRYDASANDTVLDPQIGQTIYEKLTPGVWTTESEVEATRKSVSIAESIGQIELPTEIINWKKSVGVHPTITITLNKLANYSSSTDSLIQEAIVEYMNALPINTNVTTARLYAEVIYADPLFQGRPTFTITSIKFPGNTDSYTSEMTYFDYVKSNITIA